MLQRVLSPVVELRREEATTAVMMFGYSFLAMTAYNILKPITRSKFIADLGPDNLPYVLLAAGILIGILMTGYSWLMARLPERGGAADHPGRDVGDALRFLVPVPGCRRRGSRSPST